MTIAIVNSNGTESTIAATNPRSLANSTEDIDLARQLGWARASTPIMETWQGLNAVLRFTLLHGGLLKEIQAVSLTREGFPARSDCPHCEKHVACHHLTEEQRLALGEWRSQLDGGDSTRKGSSDDTFSLEAFLTENGSTDGSFEDWEKDVETLPWEKRPVESLVKAVSWAQLRRLHLLAPYDGVCGVQVVERCLLQAHDTMLKASRNTRPPKRRCFDRFTTSRPEWEKFFIDIIREYFGQEGLRPQAPLQKQDCMAGYADRLEQRLPALFTIGSDWYFYEHGVWSRKEIDPSRPIALNALPREKQTARYAQELLKTVEGRRQVERASLRMCYLFHEDAVLINCANGVLRVTAESITLGEHEARYRFTGQLAASYRPGAECDNFIMAIASALPDDSDVEATQWWSGYMLYPALKHRVALVCFGPTQTGKSTIFEYGFGHVFGYDPENPKNPSSLFTSLSLSDICAENGYSLPRLEGAAVNLGGELNPDEIAGSDRLKLLIGGESIQVRPIFKAPYDMRGYSVKLFFLANHLPRFKSGTDAEVSRLRFLSFHIKPPRLDPDLKHRVFHEADGIFSQFMVPGLQMVLRGDPVPEGGVESRRIRNDFSLMNDPVGAFVRSCCVMDSRRSESKDRLLRAFTFFAEENDLSQKLCKSEVFFKKLREKCVKLEGYRPNKGGDREQRLRGITLREGVELAESALPALERDW